MTAASPSGRDLVLAVVFAVASVCWLTGSVLIYSDATGQRPVHNIAMAGLMLLWVPVTLALGAVLLGD